MRRARAGGDVAVALRLAGVVPGMLSLCLDEPRGRTPGRMLVMGMISGLFTSLGGSLSVCLDDSHLPGMNGSKIHNVGQNAQSRNRD